VFAGKCPSCGDKTVSVQYRGFTARQHMGTGELLCVSYTCGKCETILGVEVDPIALMADQTARIAKRLGAKDR
jgi:RNA polymerase subunit RPABC4/transcription elongation factor Spt4